MEIKKNNVIARDYVEKNYIHKDKIRELIEIKRKIGLQSEADVLEYLLKD